MYLDDDRLLGDWSPEPRARRSRPNELDRLIRTSRFTPAELCRGQVAARWLYFSLGFVLGLSLTLIRACL